MRRMALASGLLSVAAAVAWPQPPGFPRKGDARLKGLDALVTGIMSEWKIPGLALAIVDKDQVLFCGGFGHRELRLEKPIDAHTLFPIYSCTKAFTAALIGILAEEGRIDIDRPPREYLPILQFSDPLLTLQVTPRDMLTHRTGIAGHGNSWYGSENAPRDGLVRLIRYFPKSAGLREKFQYNNYMYTALGAMAEHVDGGKTWEEQVKERILAPLHMGDTSPYESQLKNENAARPHELSLDMEAIEIPFEYSKTQNMAPCGSIVSTAADMAKWLIAWINGGKVGNQTIIPKAFCSQAISTQWGSPSGPSGNIQYLGYGFGWNVALYRSHYSVLHGGGGNGFSSLVLFLPGDNLGFVLLANIRASDALMIIANSICDKLLKLPSIDWNKDQTSAYRERQRKLKDQFLPADTAQNPLPPSHSLVDYCGTYAHPAYGKITVFSKGDSLYGSYGSMNVRFRHENGDAFTAFVYQWEELFGKIDAVNRPAVFRQNARGEIAEMTILLERAVDPIVFKK